MRKPGDGRAFCFWSTCRRRGKATIPLIGSEVDSPRFRPNALELAAMLRRPICRRLEKTGWKWSCLVLLCAAVHGAAQITPADGSPSPKLIPRTKSERDAQYAFHHRILLNVQVTDSSGHAVTGLNASTSLCKSATSLSQSPRFRRSRMEEQRRTRTHSS